jgi:hypothetical protein
MPKKRHKKTIIERVEIVDRIEVREATWDRLEQEGYRVTHSGPFTNKAMFPAVDSTWFMVIAEREVKK